MKILCCPFFALSLLRIPLKDRLEPQLIQAIAVKEFLDPLKEFEFSLKKMLEPEPIQRIPLKELLDPLKEMLEPQPIQGIPLKRMLEPLKVSEIDNLACHGKHLCGGMPLVCPIFTFLPGFKPFLNALPWMVIHPRQWP